MKNVFVITNGKKVKVGVAFVQTDGSLRIKLDSLPLNGELVIQTYNEGVCVHQEFVAGDDVDIESEDGYPIDEEVTLPYQNFDMVQPS